MWNIDVLNSSDVDGFLDVINDSFGPNFLYEEDEEKFQRKLDSPDYFNLGYFINDELVGILHTTVDENDIYINLIGVKEKYQNQGIATQLLNYFQERLNFFDGGKITLDCCEELIPFYNYFGFKISRENDYLKGREFDANVLTVYTMEKNIQRKMIYN